MDPIRPQPSFRATAIDLFERVWVVGLFGLLATRLAPGASAGDLTSWLLLAGEGLIALFVLIRRPARELSLKPHEWVLAFAATSGPLLVAGGGQALAPAAVCAALMTAGILLQLWAKLTLRRSFGIVPANRGVKAEGPYRLVRHPMYAGYLLMHLGFWLTHPTLWNAAIYLSCLGLQCARLLAEERLLARDPAYLAMQGRVRWRLAPGVF